LLVPKTIMDKIQYQEMETVHGSYDKEDVK